MEKFEIMYRGAKLQGTKSDNGDIIIHLPERKDSKGKNYIDTIERTLDGWLYSSTDLNDPNYFNNIWLNDDFTMSRSNSNQKQIKTAPEKFDPNMKPGKSLINDQCRIIYEIVGKMFEYELFGRPAEEVLKLRQEWLSTSLQILGYSSTDRVKKDLNDSAGYMALSMIHHQLGGVEYETVGESEVAKDVGIKNIGAFLHQKNSSNGEKKYNIHIPQDFDRATLKGMVEQLEKYLQANKELIEMQEGSENRDGKLDLIRGVLPDYCLNMREKISEKQWELYSRMVSETAKTLLAINYDIVPEVDRTNIPDATKLDKLEFGDLIGNLVDSQDAMIASNIENMFVVTEINRFEKQVDYLIGDDKIVENSSVAAALKFLKSQEEDNKESRKADLQKFDVLDKKMFHTGVLNPENEVQPKNEENNGGTEDKSKEDDDNEFGY